MPRLPDFSRDIEHENAYYQSLRPKRFAKVLAHYELYKRTLDLEGDLVECGVFKGVSLSRFWILRHLLGPEDRKILGFDVFGKFPEGSYAPDVEVRRRFVAAAGETGLTEDQVMAMLSNKGPTDHVELVSGDVTRTARRYVEEHPELRIALLNLDTDLYEPAKAVLEALFPRIVRGGILMVDNYGVFPGETQAAREFLGRGGLELEALPFSRVPAFVVKP